MDLPQFSDTGVQLPIHPLGIAFDMDGTLLDYDGHLSESVARAVRLITKTGIRVFIVSGRLQSGSEKYWEELELDTPIVSCNGAYIGFPGEQPLHHLRLDAACRDIIMEAEKEFGLYVNYCIDNAVYSLTDGPDRDMYSAHYSFVALAPDREDIRSRNNPTKCLCITAEADQARILAMFKERLGDNVVLTRSNNRFIEIMPLGADKGEGLRFVAEWASIPMDRFIAVGDALNDLPMLREAGFAISFKSGDPRLAEYVDMLLPPLWEDGIDVLAKYVLGMTNSGRFLTPRSSRFFRNPNP